MSVRSLTIGQIGSNRQLFQAYHSWQEKKNGNGELIEFFSLCEESKLMPQLIQLPWDANEEEGLINYLLNISTAKNAKLQAILFLLLKGKIDRAEKYKEQCLSVDEQFYDSAMIISAIIDSYAKHLPQYKDSTINQPVQEPNTPKKFDKRRRSRKRGDSLPSHPMQLRASSKKKSLQSNPSSSNVPP